MQTAEFDSPFAGRLIYYWQKHDQKGALEAALTFAKDARPILKKDATLALGYFSRLPLSQFKKLESCLATQVSSESDDIVCAAVDAIKRQISYENQNPTVLMSNLSCVALTPTPPVRAELIRGFSKLRFVYTEELQIQIIALMKTTSSDQKEALSRTDWELSLLDVTLEKDLIFDVLTSILALNVNPPSFDNLESITHKIQTAPDTTLGWYISKWLLDGGHTICKQINSLLSPSRTQPYTFDIGELSLTDQQVFYFSRKIFVYLFSQNNAAVSLLCECLLKVKLSSRKNLEKHISSFWLRNYRGDIKLFKEVYALKSDKSLSKSIERIRKHHHPYLDSLKNAATNLAFQPSTNERSIQIDLKQEQSQAIIDEIKTKSPLVSSLPSKIVLYGRSCVTYFYTHEYQEPIRNTIQMSELRTSAKIPSMSVLCPAHLTKMMNFFCNERLPK